MGEKRLSDELSRYGYVFSVKKTGVLYLIAFSGLLGLGRLFSLHLYEQISLCIIGLFFFPFFLRNSLKNQFYQKRFSDLNLYMEQFIYSFLKTGKILATLEDLSLVFEKEEIKEKIEEAKEYILHTYDEEDVEKKALKIIEDEYENYILSLIHRFCLQAESLGGEYASTLQILLESRRIWTDRIYENQQIRKKKRMDILISVAVSILICLLIYMISYRMKLGIENHPVAQVITVIVLGLDFFIFYKADVQLSFGYSEEKKDEEIYVDYYRYLKETTPKSPWQKLKYHTYKKVVTQELEKAFSRWLMVVSLLLQSENVQVAIYRSYDDAPLILKPALKDLISSLRENPDGIEPYVSFLEEFTLPEVHSAMKMLYSVSEGYGGNYEHQIAEILDRNQRMLHRSEQLKTEDSLAGLYGLFLAPQITAGVKMVVDLVLVMAVYFTKVFA